MNGEMVKVQSGFACNFPVLLNICAVGSIGLLAETNKDDEAISIDMKTDCMNPCERFF